MFGDMMGKLQEMKQQVEASKARLDNITVKGESMNGQVSVIVNGNKQVKSIQLPDQFQTLEKEELEDHLLMAMNKALQQAEKVYEAEMAGAAKGMMPNIPGMGNLFGK